MLLFNRFQLSVMSWFTLFAALFSLSAIAGDIGRPTLDLEIIASKSVYSTKDTMQIKVTTNISKISDTVADLYVAVQEPDSNIRVHLKKSQWLIEPWKSPEDIYLSLYNRAIGPYRWFFILCTPGTDPLDKANWIAYNSLQLSVLPNNALLPKISSPRNDDAPLLIAHAGGVINGKWGTNALEALEKNYQKGIRYFEMDFSWTSDKYLVSIHDWSITLKTLFSHTAQKPSYQAYKAMPMVDGLTQMTIDSILEWLSTHHDAYIITDIKEKNINGLSLIAQKSKQLQHQFIPQIYQLKDFDEVKKMGFDKIIFTIYKTNLTDVELLKLSTSKPLFAVTMPVHRAFSSPLASLLSNAGLITYAHTINQLEVFQYLRGQAIYGIYTDQIHPEKVNADTQYRE
jgi:glycerophosphoryl diester phosphodiesterase